MYKKLSIYFLSLGIFGFHLMPSTLHAQSDISTDKMAAKEELQQNIRDRIQNLKDDVATRQAERRAALAEHIQDRVTNRFGLMARRMRAALTRLGNIMDRIESRLEKLSNKGVDTAKLEDQLDEARAALADAEAIITTAEAEFSDIVVESDTPREGFAIIKDAMKQFVDQLKQIHTMLKDIVSEMRVSASRLDTGKPDDDGT